MTRSRPARSSSGTGWWIASTGGAASSVLRARPCRRVAAGRASGDVGDVPEARADAVARFCRGLIDAAAPSCVAVKPQLAFFEALGSRGMRAFENACAYAREAGLLVIADAKRGDIGSRRARTPRRTSSRATAARPSPTRSQSIRTPAAGRSTLSSAPASASGAASSSSPRRRTREENIQDLRLRDGEVSGRASRVSRGSGARIMSASTASRASGCRRRDLSARRRRGEAALPQQVFPAAGHRRAGHRPPLGRLARAARRARSSPCRARSTTPSACAGIGARRAARGRPRPAQEIWPSPAGRRSR